MAFMLFPYRLTIDSINCDTREITGIGKIPRSHVYGINEDSLEETVCRDSLSRRSLPNVNVCLTAAAAKLYWYDIP